METDGRLPDGTSLGDAIEAVDAATGGYPAYYMVNCAHPTHFAEVLDPAAAWTERLGGIRANASTASHAELDEAEELDAGDPVDLAERYAALRGRPPAASPCSAAAAARTTSTWAPSRAVRWRQPADDACGARSRSGRARPLS